ncbi:hypothetical protein SNS2_1528 [Streptomyces netropsis]|nr:hypothetical protein SNS2_1528 [Streptomyces netropsis]
MSPRALPRLKGPSPTTNRPSRAETAAAPADSGAPKVAARQGALSALRPDPSHGDGRHPVAWLHICAPKGAIPSATSTCECGRNRSAVGHRKVIALIDGHAAHRATCPLRHPESRAQ